MLPDRSNRTAFIFQTPTLIPWLTIKSNIELVTKPLPLSPETAQTRVEQVLTQVGPQLPNITVTPDYLYSTAGSLVQTDKLIAGVLILTTLGLMAGSLINLLEAYLLRNHQPGNS